MATSDDAVNVVVARASTDSAFCALKEAVTSTVDLSGASLFGYHQLICNRSEVPAARGSFM